MATSLSSSPISPSPQYIFSSHESSSCDDITYLSGATTILNSRHFPEAYIDTPDTSSPDMCSRPSMSSQRSSYASTTKSHLRQSNYALRQMFQNIQGELAAYRRIMLDIQSRVSNLERSSSTIGEKIDDGGPYDKTRYASSESQTWWEACQNFARNCDTPFSANEFLRTPRRFSGFDFHFDAFKSRPRTPPLTPEEEADGMQNNTPSASSDSKPSGSDQQHDNILERVAELDKTRILTQSNPQIPPGSVRNKSSSVLSVEADITALPKLPIEPTPALVAESPQRSYRGIKRMFTYKALLKSKGSEREHTFIHFNRKASGSKKSVGA